MFALGSEFLPGIEFNIKFVQGNHQMYEYIISILPGDAFNRSYSLAGLGGYWLVVQVLILACPMLVDSCRSYSVWQLLVICYCNWQGYNV